MKRFRRFITGVGMGLIAAAIYQELQKPPEERTWHGRIAGFVPYDFRLPTLERLRDAYWNPDEPRIFTDRVMGVGWAINFCSLRQGLSALVAKGCIASRGGFAHESHDSKEGSTD
ncbi:MAG: hypothetical protein ISS50_08995 [Anaerolineae bacterium]|nr:hypothetical protein [Anaerolineae bacterium]